MIMEGITDLPEIFTENHFQEILLTCGPQTFTIHRSILVTCSPYFRAMFASGMREEVFGSVKICGVDPSEFEQVVKFLYKGDVTSEYKTNGEKLKTLLDVAEFLRVEDLCRFCWKIVLSTTNYDAPTTVAFAELAVKYNKMDVITDMTNVLAWNFKATAQSQVLGVMDANQFHDLVQHPMLNVDSADVLVDAIVSWVECDYNNRRQELTGLLQMVDSDYLSEMYLSTHCDLMRKKSMLSDRCGNRQLKLSIDWNSNIGTVLQIDHNILFSGYYTVGEDVKKVFAFQCYFPDDHRWSRPKTFHTLPWLGGSVVSINSNIYFVTGKYPHIGVSPTLKCFKPYTGRTVSLRTMTTERTGAQAAVLEGRIYLVGGYLGDEGNVLSTVECYTPKDDQWKFVSETMVPHCWPKLTVSQGKLFVVGCGPSLLATEFLSSDQRCFRLECYDPRVDQWTLLVKCFFDKLLASEWFVLSCNDSILMLFYERDCNGVSSQTNEIDSLNLSSCASDGSAWKNIQVKTNAGLKGFWKTIPSDRHQVDSLYFLCDESQVNKFQLNSTTWQIYISN